MAIMEKDFNLNLLYDLNTKGQQLFIVDWIDDIQKNICLFQVVEDGIFLILYYDDYCNNIINSLPKNKIQPIEWRGYNCYLIKL